MCLLLAVAVHAVSILLACAALRGKDGTCGVLRFGAVFSNCGFMGYPLMTALLGSIGVFYGSAYVVVFTVLTWTMGVYMITHDTSKLRLKSILLNPGVLSVAAGHGAVSAVGEPAGDRYDAANVSGQYEYAAAYHRGGLSAEPRQFPPRLCRPPILDGCWCCVWR